MASSPCTVSLGRVVSYYDNVKNNSPAASGFIVVLLKAATDDDSLADFDTLSAMLADASTTEADFTNYTRKTVTDADLAAVPSPDDANNRIDLDFPDQSWTSAGGTTDNSLVKAVICYAPDTAGADSTLIPVAQYDYAVTTTGVTINLTVNASGFYRVAR